MRDILLDKSELTRIYKGPGYTVKAHPKSCFFCQHLTDIWWDYTNGPYMFMCEKRQMTEDSDEDPIEIGMHGNCPDFMESEE